MKLDKLDINKVCGFIYSKEEAKKFKAELEEGDLIQQKYKLIKTEIMGIEYYAIVGID